MGDSMIAFSRISEELRTLYKPPQRRISTYRKMCTCLGELGVLCESASDLTAVTVARWLADHAERSRYTNRSMLGVVRTVCNYAKACGYVDRTPFEFRTRWIDAPLGGSDKPRRHISIHEVSTLLSESERRSVVDWRGARLHALVSILALTGMRKNEALYLHVSDVDIPRGVVSIGARRALKTAASCAVVPIPDALSQTLSEWIPRAGSEWLIPGSTRRGPWTGGGPGYRPLDSVRELGRSVGIPDLTMHMLRHTYATHAASWGLDSSSIQHLLRHTSIRTQDHYRHLDIPNVLSSIKAIRYA